MTLEDVELFELSMWGGSAEKRYRSLRPEIPALPWGTLDLSGITPEQCIAARRTWTDAALQEFAGASEHAVTLAALVQLRLPLDILALASRMPTDELAHAEICARMVNELGGGTPLAFEPAQVLGGRRHELDGGLQTVLMRVIRDCCVGETVSHHLQLWLGSDAIDPLARQLWRQLARDEAEHARLGWYVVDWALEELPDETLRALQPQVMQALEEPRELARRGVGVLPATAFTRVSAWGSSGPMACREKIESIVNSRVVPRLRSRGLLP